MICPNCKVADNKVPETEAKRFGNIEIQLRLRRCKACGIEFRTYEIRPDEDATAEQIAEIIKESVKQYPPVIKPYRWYQGILFK